MKMSSTVPLFFLVHYSETEEMSSWDLTRLADEVRAVANTVSDLLLAASTSAVVACARNGSPTSSSSMSLYCSCDQAMPLSHAHTDFDAAEESAMLDVWMASTAGDETLPLGPLPL